jgi:NRPS condensation-like uncharacterized protein
MGMLTSNNFVMVARIDGLLDEVTIKDALAELIQAQVMLRAKIENKSIRIMDYVAPEMNIISRADDQYWQRITEEEINRAIPVQRFPLWRFTWLKGEGQHELLMTFNHLIADGRSGVNFFESLLKRMDDKGFSIPENSLFPPFENQFKKRESLFSYLRTYSGAMFSFFADRRKKWKRLSGDHDLTAGSSLVSRSLLKKDLTVLVDRCRQNSTTLSCYLSALMIKTFPEAGDGNVGLTLAVDVRPFLKNDQSHDIGYFVATVDMIKSAGFIGDEWELSKEFKDDLERKCRAPIFKFDQLIFAIAVKLKKDNDGFHKLLKSANRNSMLLTNLGKISMTTEFKRFELTECFHVPSVHFLSLPYISLATATLNNRMIFNFTYSKAYFSQSYINSKVDRFMAELVTLSS